LAKKLLLEADKQAINSSMLNAKSARIYSNWGIVLKTLAPLFPKATAQIYARALHKLERALQLDDKDSSIHENIGLIYSNIALTSQTLPLDSRLAIFEKAQSHFTTAIDLNPDSLSEYVNKVESILSSLCFVFATILSN